MMPNMARVWQYEEEGKRNFSFPFFGVLLHFFINFTTGKASASSLLHLHFPPHLRTDFGKERKKVVKVVEEEEEDDDTLLVLIMPKYRHNKDKNRFVVDGIAQTVLLVDPA